MKEGTLGNTGWKIEGGDSRYEKPLKIEGGDSRYEKPLKI
jgi:hypothetical protein